MKKHYAQSVEFFCTVFLTLLVLAGCQIASPGSLFPQLPPQTPADAVIQHVNSRLQPGEQLRSTTISGTQSWPLGGVLVLYSYEAVQADTRATDMHVGYAITEQDGQNWVVRRSKAFGRTPPPQLIAYKTDIVDGQTLLFGKTMTSTITFVEADFQDGSSATTRVQEDAFALAVAQETSVQEVRFLNEQREVVASFSQSEVMQ